MTIDLDCLMIAKPENLARLARSLRIGLPPIPSFGPAVLRWRRQAAKRIHNTIVAERNLLTRANAPW